MIRKILILAAFLLMAGMAFASDEIALNVDIPPGYEAGILQELDLVKGEAKIDGKLYVLAAGPSKVMALHKRFWGTVRGKVVVFHASSDAGSNLISDLFFKDRLRQ